MQIYTAVASALTPQSDALRHSELQQLHLLEFVEVEPAQCVAIKRVQRLVDEGARRVFDSAESVVEDPRRFELRDERVGDRLPGLVVQRVRFKHLRRSARSHTVQSENTASDHERLTSGRDSQCSKSCDGSSTKSRRTLVPASRCDSTVLSMPGGVGRG